MRVRNPTDYAKVVGPSCIVPPGEHDIADDLADLAKQAGCIVLEDEPPAKKRKGDEKPRTDGGSTTRHG